MYELSRGSEIRVIVGVYSPEVLHALFYIIGYLGSFVHEYDDKDIHSFIYLFYPNPTTTIPQ